MVDERDFIILSRLRTKPFASYESIGRTIGLSGKAARNRLEELTRIGVLRGLRALPAAHLFHRYMHFVLFKNPVTSQEILGDVISFENVVFASLHNDNSVGVSLYDRDPQAAPPEKLVSILGPVEYRLSPLLSHEARPVSLSELRVVRTLLTNPRIPIKELSQNTRLSQKTAKRIRNRLIDDGLIHIEPVFQTARSQGLLLYDVLAVSERLEVFPAIRQIMPKAVETGRWVPPAISFFCWADSLADVLESEGKLKDIKGVKDIRLSFHTQAVLAESRLLRWFSELESQLERSRDRSGKRTR